MPIPQMCSSHVTIALKSSDAAAGAGMYFRCERRINHRGACRHSCRPGPEPDGTTAVLSWTRERPATRPGETEA